MVTLGEKKRPQQTQYFSPWQAYLSDYPSTPGTASSSFRTLYVNPQTTRPSTRNDSTTNRVPLISTSEFPLSEGSFDSETQNACSTSGPVLASGRRRRPYTHG